LNASTATSTFLDKRWFRVGAIAIVVLVVLSFSIPIFAPLFSDTGNHAAPANTSNTLAVPDFELPTAFGGNLRLSDELARNDTVVLVFYRGFF
jgi:hypothetical protein